MSDNEKQYRVQNYVILIGKRFQNTSVLHSFCQATVLLSGDKYMACSCVLPLLSSLKKHMAVNDDDPGYIARFKVASFKDFRESVGDTISIEILKIAKALHQGYKILKCLSHDAKEQTWSHT